MRGSYEPVPAFECNPCLWMLVPKRDERVTRNDPHGGLYHVPILGTSSAERLHFSVAGPVIVEWRPAPWGLVPLLVSLS